MGYNRNSQKEVVYGPKELFGYGIHDYYIEQGIRQLTTALVGHFVRTARLADLCGLNSSGAKFRLVLLVIYWETLLYQ
jgi:hypothetical protein